MSKLFAGLPDSCSAMTVNHFCASGLSSIGLAANACALGQSRLALAGGVECMSQVPFMADKAAYYSDTSLPVTQRYLPVAVSADLLATQFRISRSDLDEVTAQSHRRAASAQRYQSSRLGIFNPDGSVMAQEDECIRPQTNRESLALLPPAFESIAAAYAATLTGRDIDYRHSIANAPAMVDGAALALVGNAGASERAPRARILGWTDAGADPGESLTGGMAAMDKLLKRLRVKLADIDRIEFMEAFAVVPVLFQQRYDPDPARVNISGGHLAKGHPMGATGAVLLSTLCDVLERDDKPLGLVVATGASGTGSAMLIERVN
ncbi:MAG: acetyl-CoA C-acetyltransferase [Bermanella sp.]